MDLHVACLPPEEALKGKSSLLGNSQSFPVGIGVRTPNNCVAVRMQALGCTATKGDYNCHYWSKTEAGFGRCPKGGPLKKRSRVFNKTRPTTTKLLKEIYYPIFKVFYL